MEDPKPEGGEKKKRIVYSDPNIRAILKTIAPEAEIFSIAWLTAYKAYDQLNALAKFEGNKIVEKKAEHKPTLWEPGNVHNTVRLLIEENKINVTWKYLIAFKTLQKTPVFEQKMKKSAIELNEPLETLLKVSSKFEDLLGTFLEFATSHYQLLQLSELSEILKYITSILRSAVTGDSLLSTLKENPGSKCQEVLILSYVSNIFRNAQKLKESVLEMHLKETDLFLLSLQYILLFWQAMEKQRLLIQMGALSDIVESEAFEVYQKAIVGQEKVGEALLELGSLEELWDKTLPQDFGSKQRVRAIRELCEKKKLFG